MKRFALSVLVILGTASLAEARPFQRLRCRIQQRPVVRHYAAPLCQVVQNVAQSRPVATLVQAFGGARVCGAGGCK